jgi:thiol-disulfide isomerase/thioredoxin
VTWAGRGLVAVIGALLAVNLVWVARNYDELRPIDAGDVAPPFALPEVDRSGELTGNRIALDDLRGQVVLLDFWAEWCKPCRKTIPHVEQVYRRYRDRGLAVVSIKTDGPDMGRATDIVAATSFPIVLDGGRVADTYRVNTIPHLVLIDHLGVIRHVHRGGASAPALAGQVEALLRRRKVDK